MANSNHIRYSKKYKDWTIRSQDSHIIENKVQRLFRKEVQNDITNHFGNAQLKIKINIVN